MALVPYDENLLLALSKLHQTSAEFNLANHGIRLIVLCMFLEMGKVDLKGKRSIELGAGTGLVGIIAALLGASLTITDREPALEFLASNVHENIPPSQQGAVRVSELTWGENLHLYPTDSYDLILGAEIFYLEETFPALLQTLKHLSSENTVVLLSCQIRYERDEHFLVELRRRFSVQEGHYESQRDIYRAVKNTTNTEL
uniref:Protein N-lysine methyltransferase METTL21A n=1 Tax=Cyprinus carpio carpio TaxID=630221 RepID=A0A9J7Z1P5_CYPCA